MKDLIERLRTDRIGVMQSLGEQAADALEALQSDLAKHRELLVYHLAVIDQLRAELADLRAQKPFAWYDPSADRFTRDRDDPTMNRGATLWRLFLDAPQMEAY